jgi:type I restriction enzyme R subunit
MDLLAALAVEKDSAAKAAKESGLAPKAFAVSWTLRDNSTLKKARVDPHQLAKEVEKLMARFPNANVNADEQRQLRAALYQPLLGIGTEERTEIVNLILGILMQ